MRPTISPAPVARATGTVAPMPTAAATAPAPPTSVEVTRQGCFTGREGSEVPSGTCTTTVSWDKIATEGTEVLVYGITGCLARKDGQTGGSCLETNTQVPPASRTVIARGPAPDGAVSWTGPAWLDVIVTNSMEPRDQEQGVDRHGNDIYFAIVVATSNGAGQSPFVIADAGSWCYDTGCEGP